MIIYPAIDLMDGRCVQLRRGDPLTAQHYDEAPQDIAKKWIAEGAESIHVVNLNDTLYYQERGLPPTSAAREDEPSSAMSLNLEALRAIRAAVAVPIQFAGGLRSMTDLILAQEIGADRMVLGTSAVFDPALVRQAVRTWGADRIVAAIEVKNGNVVTHGWQNMTHCQPLSLGHQVYELGIRTVLYTNVLMEGMLQGPDIAGAVDLARETGLGVIVSGGVHCLADIEQLAGCSARQIVGVVLGLSLYSGKMHLSDAIVAARQSRSG